MPPEGLLNSVFTGRSWPMPSLPVLAQSPRRQTAPPRQRTIQQRFDLAGKTALVMGGSRELMLQLALGEAGGAHHAQIAQGV